MNIEQIMKLLVEKPMAVFIVLSCLFGYGYWMQSKDMDSLQIEVGGLRVETAKLHELMTVEIELATSKCESHKQVGEH
jgi:hypothetical protein